MKISVEYENFVQDLVLRITSNPGFNPVNAEIEKALQHAFRVSQMFFARWPVEKSRLEEELSKLPATWQNVEGEPNGEVSAKSKGKLRVKASKAPEKAPANAEKPQPRR